MSGYNWTNDYFSLYSMMKHSQERDQEDHSADLIDIRSMDYTETHSEASAVPTEATAQLAVPNYAMMSNLDALTSLQCISSLLQRANISDAPPSTLPLPPSPWLAPPPQPMATEHQYFSVPPPSLPQPTIPRPRESYASVVQKPNPKELWKSTLVQPTADFSVFDPCSKLPEVQTQFQQSIFDPDNAEIDDIYCVLCKRNGEQREWYTSHVLKDSRGKVVCPILRKYTCPNCGAIGDNAHTLKHCPKSKK